VWAQGSDLDHLPPEVLAQVPIEVIRGDRAAARGRFPAALEEYRAAAERVGTNPSIEVRASQALFGLGRCRDGLHEAEVHRTDSAWTARTSALAAACFARLGEFGEAVYWQEDAVLLDLGATVRWVMLGTFRQRLGDSRGAQEAFAEAERLDPDASALQAARGSLALDQGDLEQVEEACSLLDREPGGHPMADMLRARMYMDLGEPERGAAMALRARSRGTSPAITATVVEAMRRSGFLETASRILSRYVISIRESPELLSVQARLAVDDGRLEAAARWSDRAVALDPLRADNLGAAWYVARARGRTDEAVQWAGRWALANRSPWRTLEQYEPAPWE